MAESTPPTEEKHALDYSTLGMRVLHTLLFVIIANLLTAVLACVVLFQLGYALITQRPPYAWVSRFARRILRYALEIGQYITFNSDHPPFPFEELPNGAKSANGNATVTS